MGGSVRTNGLRLTHLRRLLRMRRLLNLRILLNLKRLLQRMKSVLHIAPGLLGRRLRSTTIRSITDPKDQKTLNEFVSFLETLYLKVKKQKTKNQNQKVKKSDIVFIVFIIIIINYIWL